MFSTESGTPIAKVLGGKYDGEIIYLSKNKKNNACCDKCSKYCYDEPCCGGCNMCAFNESSSDDENEKNYGGCSECLHITDGFFEDFGIENRVKFIAGASGVGKTSYAADYVKKYLKVYPDSDFIVMSILKEDPAIDKLDPIRINIDEEFLEEPPINIEEEIKPNSIILFDDVDNISDNKIQKAVNDFKRKIMEIGRHYNLQIIYICHLPNPNESTSRKITLNEMNTFTIFPQAGKIKQIKYVLKNYINFDDEQIDYILKLKSRWVTVFVNHPQVILSERKIILVKDI